MPDRKTTFSAFVLAACLIAVPSIILVGASTRDVPADGLLELWQRCGPNWNPLNMVGPRHQRQGGAWVAVGCWWSRSDFDHDGDVDLADYALAQINRGPTCHGPCCCWNVGLQEECE